MDIEICRDGCLNRRHQIRIRLLALCVEIRHGLRETNAFAESMGKIAIPISLTAHPIGVMGDWAAWEYQFRVVDKNDPEARRTSFEPRPDLVIEKNENISGNIRTKDETDRKTDLYTELTKLDDLRKRGLITDAEFEIEKQKLLNHSK